MDTDGFQYSETWQFLIRCADNRFLYLNEAKQFDRRDLNFQQQSCSDYKLNINVYRDLLNTGSNDGRAVILYASRDGKTYAAVCANDKEVVAEEMKELQQPFEQSQHKALFYMVQDEWPDKYKLRSSLYPEKCLGFDETDSQKLILCHNDPHSQEDIVSLF